MCENMGGDRLRKYIVDHDKDVGALRKVGGVFSQMMGTPFAGPSIFVNIKFHHMEFYHSKFIYEHNPNYHALYSTSPLPWMVYHVLKI
jgi:hypothetical protein